VTTLTPEDRLVDPHATRQREIQRIATATEGRRQLYSKVAFGVCGVCLLVALVALVAVILYTIQRGLAAWSVDFFTKLPTPTGIPGGGIWNAIVGTVIIVGIAAVFAIPFGILGGLFLAESEGRIGAAIRFSADVLAGVPAIVLGIFAYIVLVKTLGHFSAVAGSFAVGVLMLPVIMRGSETAIRSVPKSLTEAGLSLGARHVTITGRVVLPAALPGLITAIILALARGLGETAVLLFTAVGNEYFSTNPSQPMAALPLVVYQDGIQAYSDLQTRAWGTALFLVLIVLVLSVTSRLMAAWVRREKR